MKNTEQEVKTETRQKSFWGSLITIKECIVALNGRYPLIKHIPSVAEGVNITINKLERLLEKANAEPELLKMAIAYLGEWCLAVDEVGTMWDDWDEHYKNACYSGERRDSPVNKLVREYMETHKKPELP